MTMLPHAELTPEEYRQTFRDDVALQIAPKLVHLLFDDKFNREAAQAGLENDELLAAYIWQFADALWEGR